MSRNSAFKELEKDPYIKMRGWHLELFKELGSVNKCCAAVLDKLQYLYDCNLANVEQGISEKPTIYISIVKLKTYWLKDSFSKNSIIKSLDFLYTNGIIKKHIGKQNRTGYDIDIELINEMCRYIKKKHTLQGTLKDLKHTLQGTDDIPYKVHSSEKSIPYKVCIEENEIKKENNKKENTKSSSTSFFDSLSANKELLRKDILKKIGRKWIVANSDSLDLTADEIIERFVNDYHDKYSHAYVGNSFQSRGIKKYFQNWIEEQKDTLPKKLFELEPYEEVYKKVSKCTIEEGAEKELKAFVFDKSINLEDFEKYLRYLKRTNRLLLSNIYSTIKDKNYYDYTKGLSEARA